VKKLLEQYLKNLTDTTRRGDAREESYYKHLDNLIKQIAENQKIKNVDVTILPKKTEAGNPDFRIWDGKNHITGYIEAKAPSVTNLDYIEGTEQLERYCSTFPNVILTNFYEFRLYRDGRRIAQAMIGRPVIAIKLQTTPPLENIDKFKELFDLFFSFSLPRVQTARSLAIELADLHLLKSPALDPPVAKYQGSSDNDRVEKITYKEDEQRIYINKDKYFEGIAPEVWNYHIGGYQVLNKYLKDRKGRNMDEAPHYCRIVTALSKTLKIQKKIDEIYPEVEKELIDS
jgi:hypothetical protein